MGLLSNNKPAKVWLSRWHHQQRYDLESHNEHPSYPYLITQAYSTPNPIFFLLLISYLKKFLDAMAWMYWDFSGPRGCCPEETERNMS